MCLKVIQMGNIALKETASILLEVLSHAYLREQVCMGTEKADGWPRCCQLPDSYLAPWSMGFQENLRSNPKS